MICALLPDREAKKSEVGGGSWDVPLSKLSSPLLLLHPPPSASGRSLRNEDGEYCRKSFRKLVGGNCCVCGVSSCIGREVLCCCGGCGGGGGEEMWSVPCPSDISGFIFG